MSYSDGDGRPPIPAGVRRRVLVEAGHRCAIPTCRHIEVDIHHIIAWATCQKHEYENLIALCPNCHRRADRGEIDRKALRLYKFNLQYAHDKYSQLEMDVLFTLYKSEDTNGIKWPPFNRILLKRIEESGYIHFETAGGTFTFFGMDAAPDTITLTEKGRQFLDELGVHEL